MSEEIKQIELGEEVFRLIPDYSPEETTSQDICDVIRDLIEPHGWEFLKCDNDGYILRKNEVVKGVPNIITKGVSLIHAIRFTLQLTGK